MTNEKKELVQVKTNNAPDMSAVETALVANDLSKLNSDQRMTFIKALCDQSRISYLGQPFQYLLLNGKVTLYTTKNCTDQLRAVHNISIKIVAREKHDGIYIVTARAELPNGRQDESTGAVWIQKASGHDLANALMKAETKAKRRVTLSLMGIGYMDESELESVKDAKRLTEAEVEELSKKSQSPEEDVAKIVDANAAIEGPEVVQNDAELNNIATNDEILRVLHHLQSLNLSQKEMKETIQAVFNKDSMRELTNADIQYFAWILDQQKTLVDIMLEAKSAKKLENV